MLGYVKRKKMVLRNKYTIGTNDNNNNKKMHDSAFGFIFALNVDPPFSRSVYNSMDVLDLR